MTPPINIDGSTVDAVTIDGSSVSEVTVDGEVVFGNAIPDPQNLLIDWNITAQIEADGQTIDPLVDQQNNNDATAVNTPTMDIDGFNNEPAAVLNSADPDLWELSSLSITQPFTTYSVLSIDDATEVRTVFRDSKADVIIDYTDFSGWRAVAPSTIVGTSDASVNLLTTVLDGSNSLLEEDGVQTASGDAGTNAPVDLGIGGRAGGNVGSPFDGQHIRHLIYDTRHDASTRSEVTSYLSSEHGLGL